jgi:hypothetical protein
LSIVYRTSGASSKAALTVGRQATATAWILAKRGPLLLISAALMSRHQKPALRLNQSASACI